MVHQLAWLLIKVNQLVFRITEALFVAFGSIFVCGIKGGVSPHFVIIFSILKSQYHNISTRVCMGKF